MSEHELKTWPEPFAAILDGRKRFEIRKADRPFAVGDTLHLREYDPGSPAAYDVGRYTGRETRARVTYLVPGGRWGLAADLCVMGIAPAAAPQPEPRDETLAEKVTSLTRANEQLLARTEKAEAERDALREARERIGDQSLRWSQRALAAENKVAAAEASLLALREQVRGLAEEWEREEQRCDADLAVAPSRERAVHYGTMATLNAAYARTLRAALGGDETGGQG